MGKSPDPSYNIGETAMDIYKTKSLDCSIPKNRKILATEALKILKADELPTKLKLKEICKRISKKYKMPLRVFKAGTKYQVNINVEGNSYSTFLCLTPTEVYLKYILFVKAWMAYKKEVSK